MSSQKCKVYKLCHPRNAKYTNYVIPEMRSTQIMSSRKCEVYKLCHPGNVKYTNYVIPENAKHLSGI